MPDLLNQLEKDIYIGQNPKTYEWKINNPGVWTDSPVVKKYTRYIKYSEHEKLLKQKYEDAFMDGYGNALEGSKPMDPSEF